MTVIPSTGSATTAGSARGSGISTSIHDMPVSLSDLPTVRPSRTTLPSAARSATAVREMPRSRDTPASTRSPSRPSGTGNVRTSPICGPPALSVLATRAVVVDPPQDGHREHDHPRDQAGVRHIEDRPPPHGHEVHHVAAQHPRRPHEAVHEIARGATEDQSEAPRPPARVDPPGER